MAQSLGLTGDVAHFVSSSSNTSKTPTHMALIYISRMKECLFTKMIYNLLSIISTMTNFTYPQDPSLIQKAMNGDE